MKLTQRMKDMMQFVSEAFLAIFNKPKGEYPNIGVQPFEGEPYSKWMESR